jgi:hypothetical protein
LLGAGILIPAAAIMDGGMSDETPPSVLGSLPRTRPHRRSPKRMSAAARAATTAPKATRPAATKPAATRPPAERPARQPPPAAATPGALETAVQAAAELAEIGLQASARALRRTLSRLPHP